MRRLWCLIALLGPVPLLAQAAGMEEPGANLDQLRKLLDTPVEVASRLPVGARETPGIITVLTREEILASGARDLMEVLRFVPGFDFASDTNGVVGVGVRTSWGHDGKVLLLIDGQEMNEPLYGTLQFGGHYPIDNVLRIEIIRGPGSVIYGGYAELAVINVITQRGGDIKGVDGTFWLGRMTDAKVTPAHGHLAYGQSWGDYDLSLSYVRGAVPQGTGPWRLDARADNQEIQTGDYARLNQDFLNLKVSAGSLNLQYLRDAYSLRDYTGEFKASTDWLIKFPAEFFRADYQFAYGDWSFKPTFSIKSQAPWLYTESRTDRNTRTTGGLLSTWNASSTIKVMAGAEAVQDNTNIFWSSKGYRETYTYENRAYFFQTTWTPDFGNLDLGVRYDQHSVYGTAASPRLAFTKATKDWHFKFLAAGAFRAPSIENLFVSPGLVPERTVTYEAEVGHALGATTYLSANAYHMRVHNPISYANPAPGVNGYFNFDHTGARGLELGLRSLGRDYTVQSTLSLSRADDKNADFYHVTGQSAYHIGFSNLKFTTQAQWRFLPGWSLNPGLLVLGPRYGYRFAETQPSRFGTTTQVNLFLSHSFSYQVEAGLNITNLGNATNSYIQGYGVPGIGGNPPLPGPGREVDLRLSLHF
jgi:outer membrane cobalamin receptor